MRLIVIAGPAGSGKSTLANSVAEDLGIPHLDFDTVSHEIIEIRRNENPELSEPELLETFKSERFHLASPRPGNSDGSNNWS